MRSLARRLCVALCLAFPLVWAGCASTPTRQSTGEYVDDSVLTAKVKTELGADKMLNLFTVSVETYNGIVQLSGFVNTNEQAEHAVAIAPLPASLIARPYPKSSLTVSARMRTKGHSHKTTMKTSMVRSLIPTRFLESISHWSGSRRCRAIQMGLTLLSLSMALLASSQTASAAGVPVIDPELAQMGARLREFLSQTNSPAPSDPSAPDATLFLRYDPKSEISALGRRDTAQGDAPSGKPLAQQVNFIRPSVTEDGNAAVFVSSNYDLCMVRTAEPDSRQCLNFPGRVYSADISPNAKLAALVLIDPEKEDLEDKITVLDLVNNKATAYKLAVPVVEGAVVEAVLHAEVMSFSSDGGFLFYDALCQIQYGQEPIVQSWSVYALNLATGTTSMLAPPFKGLDTGNPAASRSSNRYVAFDARQTASGTSTILVVDLTSAQTGRVVRLSQFPERRQWNRLCQS
jgi:hypothetical protein